MKRWIFVCALLVVVQAGLTLWTNVAQHGNTGTSGKGPLLSMQANAIDGLMLADAAGHTLNFNKREGRWLLPDSGNFPADAIRLQALIDSVFKLQRGWPEATTSEAATRFKVAPDNFAYKLTLLVQQKPASVIYFGSSPGLRKLYLRVEKDTDIPSMTISVRDLEPKAGDWIDTTVLHLKSDQVARVHLPNLELVQGKNGLQPADLKDGEILNTDKRDMLVNRLTGLSISAILGKEIKPEYGLEHPVLAYSLALKDGSTISYTFGQTPKPADSKVKPAAENSYVLKVTGQEQLLRVEGWQVDALKKANRQNLVKSTLKEATTPVAPQTENGPAETPILPMQAQPATEAASPAPVQ